MKKWLQHRSIQMIISISFTAIAIVGMSFMGIVLYTQFSQTTRREAIESNKQLLDQANLNLHSYLRSMMGISDAMYFTVIKNRDLTREPIDKEMNLLYEANKDNLISIACITENGSVMAAAPVAEQKKGIDIKNQSWFIQANEKIDRLHFTTPYVQNLFESSNFRYYWVVTLSRSVELTDVGSTRMGVLMINMNFSSIEQLLTKANEKGAGYVYLTDRNGEIIYHPKQSAIYSGLHMENNQAVAEYEDGEHVEEFHGEKRVVLVKSVGYTGWKLVSVIPVKEFYVNMYHIRLFTIMIAFLTIFLILSGNIIISSRVTDPIRKLEDSINDLESGNWDMDVYIGGTHEIRHLGRTINFMVKQMKQLMEERVREQQEKRRSELDVLQSQINPHFLYNTLDSVVWLVENAQYQKAIAMITSLAKLFRISLSKGKNIIPIRDEIAHAKSYMDIQQIRYKNKFDIEFDIDPAIEDYSTIKLIIQPLLENAIYYGVQHMEDNEGKIILRGYEKDEDIFLDVIDNGMGMKSEVVELLLTDDTRVRKKGAGIGLRNIDQRIRLYFKGDYGLSIQSELDEGTTVRICLPKQPFSQIQAEERRRT